MTRLTISIDEALLERARKVAEERGISVDALIAESLARLELQRSPEEVVREMRKLWAEESWSSDGENLTREEIHERRRFR